MSGRAEYWLECDGCGTEDSGELKPDESLDNIIDSGNGEWFKVGILLDRLLCEECYEKEGDS
jgi:hypothetical protein